MFSEAGKYCCCALGIKAGAFPFIPGVVVVDVTGVSLFVVSTLPDDPASIKGILEVEPSDFLVGYSITIF